MPSSLPQSLGLHLSRFALGLRMVLPVTARAAHDLVAAGAAGDGAAHRGTGAVGAGTAHRVVTALTVTAHLVMTAGAAFQWPSRLILRGQKRFRGGCCHTRCKHCCHFIAYRDTMSEEAAATL